jgi:hypothetical protein
MKLSTLKLGFLGLFLATAALAVPPYPTVWYREKVQQMQQQLSGARPIPGPLVVEGSVTAGTFAGGGLGATNIVLPGYTSSYDAETRTITLTPDD